MVTTFIKVTSALMDRIFTLVENFIVIASITNDPVVGRVIVDTLVTHALQK
jgi:hypothetical protein